MAAAREDLEQRSANAAKLLVKAEAKRARADQARADAARQQLLLADQIAALEAAKEAATISELAAEQAWVRSAAQRTYAEKAKQAADVARAGVASSYDYVRSVLQRLRDAGNGIDARPNPDTSAVAIGAAVAEHAATTVD